MSGKNYDHRKARITELQSGFSFQNENIVTSWLYRTLHKQIHCMARRQETWERERENENHANNGTLKVWHNFNDPLFWNYNLYYFVT